VTSSNSGGLREAKRGTAFVIPVRPIQRFQPVFDETHMPAPVEEAQDIEPWTGALLTLLTNKQAYLEESERSRRVAEQFVARLRIADFEDMLMRLKPSSAAVAAGSPARRIDQLSPAKRALLLKRLKQHDAHSSGS
jgi:hypothetical protein